jgi:hypothetical protein
VNLVRGDAVEWTRVGRIVTAQAGYEVHRQQNAQYEKTFTEPVGNLAADRFWIAGLFAGLWQADLPYQLLVTGTYFYCVLFSGHYSFKTALLDIPKRVPTLYGIRPAIQSIMPINNFQANTSNFWSDYT